MKTNTEQTRKEFLDQLVEDLNSAIKGFEEYAFTPDSSHGEYVATLGYGDGEIDLEYVSDTAKELIALIPKGKKKEALCECSDVEQVGVHYQENEVFRVMLGELKNQIDGEILERVESLSIEEYEQVRCRIDGYMSERHRDLIYTSHDHEGFALILDEEKLVAWLNENGVECRICEEHGTVEVK